MNSYPIHLCLVSDQVTQNLVPACDPKFAPETVIMMVGKRMQGYAYHLEGVLKGRGVESVRLIIENPYDPVEISRKTRKVLEENAGRIALNSSGGTKVMAMASYQVFSANNEPVFFVHPEEDTIVWLNREDPPSEVPDHVTLPEFLKANGYYTDSLDRQPVRPELSALSSTLISDIERLRYPLMTLNFLARSAERNNLRSPVLTAKQLSHKDLVALIEIFEKEDLVRRDGHCLVFKDERSRFFVNGGWLEHYIFNTILKLKDRLNIRDCAMSVEVRSSSGTPNEIDVAFLWNNQLHMVECKARRFKGNDPQEGPGAETLYKMDTIRDFGGMQTKAMLASYQDLPKWDQQRAKDLKIKTLVGSDLRNLEYQLLQWILPS